MLPVAFGVPPEVADETAGRTQAVRQLATCELQVIMQLVVVEVSGVARPVSGGVTVGMELCASPSRVLPPMTIAARRAAVFTPQRQPLPSDFMPSTVGTLAVQGDCSLLNITEREFLSLIHI